MKRSLAGFTCCLFLAMVHGRASAVEVRDFPLMKKLSAPEQATHDVGCVCLDDDVFASTADAYANMRIFNSEGEETRFLVRVLKSAKEKTVHGRFEMRTLSFKELDGNRAEIILEKKPNQSAPVSVEIVTHQVNYEKEISVFGSDTRADWIELAGKRPIFDYSKYIDVRNNTVDLQPKDFKYYRIQVANIAEANRSPLRQIITTRGGAAPATETEKVTVTDENLRIEKMVFRYPRVIEVNSHPVLRSYDVSDLETEEDTKERRTIVTFRTARQPLTELIVETTADNFNRSIRVETGRKTSDGIRWSTLADGRISRINIASIRREDIAVPLGKPTRSPLYRLTVKNADSPPLAITGIKAEGETHAAFFPRSAGDDYRLLYGATRIKAPQYDIAQVLGAVARDDADLYSLSGEEANADHAPKAAPRQFGNKSVFVVALIIMAATLAWLVARAAKNLPAVEE